MIEQKNISLFSYSKNFTSKQIIKISDFITKPYLDLNLSYYYIHIDISYKELLNNSKLINEELIYKLYFYQKNYFIFTYHSLKRLNKIPKLSNLLHLNHELLNNYLYLEQIISIIKMTTTVIEYPESIIEINEQRAITKPKKLPLENLNENQLLAVKITKGPNILLAPAGSGKTKTLVNRIVHLINQGINPNNILVLAFNKKAELELTTRLNQKFHLQTNIKTFHAFGNQLVKKYLNYDFDTEFKKDKEVNNNKEYNRLFSQIKNNLLTNQEIKDYKIWKLFDQYLNEQEQEKLYNFDDMIYLAIKLLLDNQELRNKVQQQYQYILIDEFQDLNKSQQMLIDIIAKPQNNLFVVGDDDQMIYRFRGATEDGILNYEKRYSICSKNILTINYRSTKNIIEHANQIISYNQNRVNKDIKAYQNEDGKLDLIIENNMYNETIKIVEYLKRYKSNEYSDVAILYRYNQYGDFLKIFLEHYNIPVANYQLEILNTYFGKIFFNYLKLIIEPHPSSKIIQSCLYIFSEELPYNFISKIRCMEDLFNITKLQDELTEKQIDICQIFIKKVKALKLDEELKIKDLIQSFNLDKKIDNQSPIDDEDISQSDTLKIILEIGKILNVSETYHYFIKNKKTSQEGVVLSTIHKTKGNEYSNVIYYHVVTPNNLLIEDERRLFYVAVTRAKKNLLITTVSSEMACFVKEYFLNKKLKSYQNLDLKLEVIRSENKINYLIQNLKQIEKQIKCYYSFLNYNNIDKELLMQYYNKQHLKNQLEIKINNIKKELYYRSKLIQ